jgi:hypothetical protein
VLQTILNNHLLLGAIILFLLLMVPALLVGTCQLRNPSRPERRKRRRPGVDRRA